MFFHRADRDEDMPSRSTREPQHSAAFMRAHAHDPAGIDQLRRSLDIVIGTADDVLDMMGICTAAAVSMIDGVHHGGITASLDGTPFTAAPTDPAVEAFDQQQYQVGDGPCLRALRTAGTVRMSAEELAARSPELGAAARAADLTDFLATALFASGVPAGSLNLYSHTVIPDTVQVNDIVTILADYLSRTVGDLESVTRRGHVAAALRDAVAGRTDIERAVGVLMSVHEVGAAAARERLIAGAEENAISVLDYARKILSSLGR